MHKDRLNEALEAAEQLSEDLTREQISVLMRQLGRKKNPRKGFGSNKSALERAQQTRKARREADRRAAGIITKEEFQAAQDAGTVDELYNRKG